MLNLIFFGTPGAGKGTQADIIAQKHGLAHLSSGNILRQEIERGELGSEIKKHLDQGSLVPDNLMIAMMEKAALANEKAGVIFDGYPRNINQAQSLQNFFKTHNFNLSAVINLEISEDEAKKRILLRGKTSGRSDDNPETISSRFKTYYEQTEPLINYYQALGKIINIDGNPDIETVAQNINQEIENIKKGL